jgi:hypothetical protein
MYKHTQVGWYILFLAIPAILILGFISAVGQSPFPVIIGIVLMALLVLFSTLTVIANDTVLRFYFGPGIVGRKFAYSDIESITQVRNHWLMGWGIRWFGHGWLYNVSGLDAIELKLKSGKWVRIGTDEPERLLAAVRSKIGQ